MRVEDMELNASYEELEDLKRDYAALLDNLKWVHAIVSILVEQEGGVVNIDKETLESYDLRGQVRIKDAEDHYEVEVVPADVDGEVV